MPKDDDQLDYLVEEYNRLADDHDSHAAITRSSFWPEC